MNQKNHIKINITLMFGLCICICAGCSAQQKGKYTREDLGNLAEIRIYAAETDELVKTIKDEKQLYQYNQCSLFEASDIEERQDELKQSLEGKKEQYDLISYKYPAARFAARNRKKIAPLRCMRIPISSDLRYRKKALRHFLSRRSF